MKPLFGITVVGILVSAATIAPVVAQAGRVTGGACYYDSILQSRGKVTPYADDCVRHENGMVTSGNRNRPATPPTGGNSALAQIGAMTCAAAIDTRALGHRDLSVAVAGSCAVAKGTFVQCASATSVSNAPAVTSNATIRRAVDGGHNTSMMTSHADAIGMTPTPMMTSRVALTAARVQTVRGTS